METKLQVALAVGGAMIVGLLLEMIWGISDRWEATTLVLGVAVVVALVMASGLMSEPDQSGYRPVGGSVEPTGRGAGSTSPVANGSTSPVPSVQVGLVTNSNRPPERVTERPPTPPVADPAPTVVITPAPVSVTGSPAPTTAVDLDPVQPPPEFFKGPRWELSRPLTDVRHPDAGTET